MSNKAATRPVDPAKSYRQKKLFTEADLDDAVRSTWDQQNLQAQFDNLTVCAENLRKEVVLIERDLLIKRKLLKATKLTLEEIAEKIRSHVETGLVL